MSVSPRFDHDHDVLSLALLAGKAEIVPHGLEVDFSPSAGRGLSHGTDDKWNLGIRNSQFFHDGFFMPTSVSNYEKKLRMKTDQLDRAGRALDKEKSEASSALGRLELRF